MTENKTGIARWPRIRLAIMNISKSTHRISLHDDDFLERGEELALRLETTAAQLRDVISEKRAE